MFSRHMPRWTWVGLLLSLVLTVALVALTPAPWWTLALVVGAWAVLIFCDEFADWEG